MCFDSQWALGKVKVRTYNNRSTATFFSYEKLSDLLSELLELSHENECAEFKHDFDDLNKIGEYISAKEVLRLPAWRAMA